MDYSGVTLDTFMKWFRKGINERIDAFEKEMSYKVEKERREGQGAIKSRGVWAREFKKWSEQTNKLKEEILRYMKEDDIYENNNKQS